MDMPKEMTVRAAVLAHDGKFPRQLACSGVIEIICGLLAMKHQTVPATLHSDPERVKLAVPLATQNVDRPVKTFLKLGVGFTGHDAASLFVKS